MQLRDYQKQQLDFLTKDDLPGVVQSPTGTGKSVVMEAYINWFISTNPESTVAVVTPNQTLNRNIARYLGNRSTLAHTGHKPNLSKQILVTTFHSASKYMESFKPDLIIGDELHRVEAKTYHAVMSQCKIRKGFTATPNRYDGKGLDSLFDDIYISPQISWFITEGYLSDYDLIALDCPLFESTKDDYNAQESIFGTKPEIQKTVKTYLEKGKGQTLIFCTNITHGIKLKEEFISKGVKASFVCSQKKDSDDLEITLEQFRNKEINVLINCQMFIEGVDIPVIETLMLCVFTFSTPKYLQMVGRLLRVLPGCKKLLIDLAGNVYYHGNPKSAYFEWNLEGFKGEKNISNRSTNWQYCFACDEPMARKKYILSPGDICCLSCGAVQYVMPPQNRKKIDFEGETFTLSNYKSEVLDAICNASIVANSHFSKYSKGEKYKLISKMNLLPLELKIKALRKAGASDNTIEQYL